ncbi:Rv1733c family protein [Streptomyces sviceus]|uniref:Rv1733c family protein n=1 Tax=Streptomyces sviceus TaxID=285530 RepID=UPI0033192837
MLTRTVVALLVPDAWRWRRNPLRRRSDVVEAWIVLATCLVALLGGLLAGEEAGAATEAGLTARRTAAHTVSAVLVEDAGAASTVPTSGTGETVRATVRWTAPDGSTRTGQARVEPGGAAGTSVTVWIDRGGNPVRTPHTAHRTSPTAHRPPPPRRGCRPC